MAFALAAAVTVAVAEPRREVRGPRLELYVR